MEKIGYIVSKNKIRNIMEGFGVITDVNQITTPKPYLVVGIGEARKLADKFSILNHKLNDKGGFWTFAKNEKRNEYERDLEEFYKYSFNNIINNIKYYYINILNINLKQVKKIIELLNNNERKYIYCNRDMVYVYYHNNIIGFSLALLEYSGFSRQKTIAKIKRNKSNIVSEDDGFLSLRIKEYLKNNKYLVPYFMSLQ